MAKKKKKKEHALHWEQFGKASDQLLGDYWDLLSKHQYSVKRSPDGVKARHAENAPQIEGRHAEILWFMKTKITHDVPDKEILEIAAPKFPRTEPENPRPYSESYLRKFLSSARAELLAEGWRPTWRPE